MAKWAGWEKMPETQLTRGFRINWIPSAYTLNAPLSQSDQKLMTYCLGIPREDV